MVILSVVGQPYSKEKDKDKQECPCPRCEKVSHLIPHGFIVNTTPARAANRMIMSIIKISIKRPIIAL
jgi:hypothetical protein